MNEVTEKQACVGCGVCAARCPQTCITMEADSEGFRYPQIDTTRCVDCALCRSVCPSASAAVPLAKPVSFAAYTRDEDIRLKSSSGGIFRLLAEQVLKDGGAVVGAAWDEDGRLVHRVVRDEEALSLLYGSKYLQSDLEAVLPAVETLLKNNQTVLFSGTPCQIAAMRAYLKKDYETLLCQGVVCHGVPSPLVWEQYRTSLEKRYGAKATAVSFRDKRDGWKAFSLAVQFENGAEYVAQQGQDPYMQCFLKNYTLRPSCYQCRFKGTRADADLLLADFWGIAHVAPSFGDDRGVSLVIVNTDRGQALWKAVQARAEVKEVPIESALPYNTAITRSVAPVPKRARFFEEFHRNGTEQAYRKFAKTTRLQRWKQRGAWYWYRVKSLLKKS